MPQNDREEVNKRYILIGTGVVLLLVGFLFWLFKPFSSPSKPLMSTTPTQKTIKVNTLPLEERPYVILEPKSSIESKSLGHWVTMTIDSTKDFERVEYEFEYTTGFMIQGGMGRINFNQEPSPVSKEIAFGTASKGKYKYDEGVYTGTFTLHFFKGNQESALRTEFNLQNNQETEGVFTSPDKKVKLVVEGRELDLEDFLIIANTLGLPAEIDGQVLSGPYGFYADSPKKLSQATITFESVEENEAVIMTWQNGRWQELETKVSGGKASAEVKSLGTFVLVEK